MFIHKTTRKVGDKTYHCLLLSESYRENGKVKHRVITNISRWPKHLIESLSSALKGKPQEIKPKPVQQKPSATAMEDIPRKSGKNFGGLFVLKKLAKDLFIEKVLGTSRQGRLAMLLILGRILIQGSRRHLTFWRDGEAVKEVLGVNSFDEDDLYETLDWLETHQQKMEEKWFKLRFENEPVDLFLYDVTSSYLEGQCNQLADYGYNRDGKKGKKQIVIGLLTNKHGAPIAVEVFKGNTSDVTTVPNQIKKMAERFKVNDVTFVGDRGMVKKVPMELLKKQGWHTITAITKPQIESLMNKDVFQLELFEEKLVEITQDNVRYFLRRNPEMALAMENNRKDRMQKITVLMKKLNEKLKAHPKSSPKIALKTLEERIDRLKLKNILTVQIKGRSLSCSTDKEGLQNASRLDGCYVIKTDLSQEKMKAEEVHSAYQGLSKVEWAFRSIKTGLLEIRPLYHRKANRTRACAFVAMFAYAITHFLWEKIAHLDKPLETVVSCLDQIQTQEIQIAGQWIPVLPTHFREDQDLILKTLNIQLPKTLQNTA